MDQPVTNEACESRRCEMRKLIKEEVRDVMATVNENRIGMNDWLIRLEKKIDDNNQRISDKLDDSNKLMIILILAVALGAIGLRMEWI
jgi:hypothetical protein